MALSSEPPPAFARGTPAAGRQGGGVELCCFHLRGDGQAHTQNQLKEISAKPPLLHGRRQPAMASLQTMKQTSLALNLSVVKPASRNF